MYLVQFDLYTNTKNVQGTKELHSKAKNFWYMAGVGQDRRQSQNLEMQEKTKSRQVFCWQYDAQDKSRNQFPRKSLEKKGPDKIFVEKKLKTKLILPDFGSEFRIFCLKLII